MRILLSGCCLRAGVCVGVLLFMQELDHNRSFAVAAVGEPQQVCDVVSC